jgi:hypothetical protein
MDFGTTMIHFNVDHICCTVRVWNVSCTAIYLGLRGKCVIIPNDQLPTLCLEHSFEVANLIKFREIMIIEFYDPHEGLIDIF